MPPWLLVLALLFGLGGPFPADAESLYIFFPTSVRPHVLQKGLGGRGLEVTAFGRFADFQDGMKTNPPDAILSLPEVIGTMEGYRVAVSGRRNGEIHEPFFLMGVDQAMEPSRLSGSTIGILDFLGRKGMQKFIADIFQPPPPLKTVAKLEDLLPLLTFKMVDGILVTRDQADYFRSLSRLNFVLTPVPKAKSGTLCLGVRKGAEPTKAILALTTMGEDLRKLLGDVRWE